MWESVGVQPPKRFPGVAIGRLTLKFEPMEPAQYSLGTITVEANVADFNLCSSGQMSEHFSATWTLSDDEISKIEKKRAIQRQIDALYEEMRALDGATEEEP